MSAPAPAAGALERLRASRRPRVLFVSHAAGGGVSRHIEDLARAIRDDAEVLWLRPSHGGHLLLTWLRAGETLALALRADEDEQALVAFLASLGVARVHIHHVHGLPRWVLDLPARLGCPFDVTLHDYFPACPAYHMTGANGRFCGGEPGCMRCGESGAIQWDLTVEAWRGLFEATLRRAERVIAPSLDLAHRLRRFFPAVSPLVWPHPEGEAEAVRAAKRILVLGAISPAKGIDLLEACLRDAAARKLALHFVVAGYLSRAIGQWPALPLTVLGEYPEGRLGELVSLARGDAIFFPAQCPESFSYTLSAAIASGLPIVATDLGALPERLAGRPDTRIVPWNASVAAINDVLLSMARPAPAAAAEAPAPNFAAYRERYVEALRGASAAPGGAPAQIPPRWLEPAPQKADDWTLAALYDDGVLRGRSEPRERLGRRAAIADAHLAEHKDLVRDKDGEIAALRSELAEAKARAADVAQLRAENARASALVAEIEARLRLLERSRSWRITAPLRAVMRWLAGEEREKRS